MFKHIAHESSRFACEEFVDAEGVISTARGSMHPKGSRSMLPPKQRYVPGMRAAGTIAFQTLYTDREGLKDKPQPAFYVEQLHHGHTWVTAPKSLQKMTLQEAINFASSLPQYRVVTQNNAGSYNPLPKLLRP